MDIKNEENIKNLFIGIDKKVILENGDYIKSINFDNAATTPPFKSCIRVINKVSELYASIGRGTGQKAEITTEAYNISKDLLLDFFNVKDKNKYTVIYTKNTTESINKLANVLPKNSKNEIVLCTRMEHHSNDLPWRRRGNIQYIEVDEFGRLKLDELEDKLIKNRGLIRYVTVSGASNVTGYYNDIHSIAKVVHRYNAKLIVDGAQLVPHMRIKINTDCEDEQIDYLVFSSHKIYSPFGIGAIIGLKDDLSDGNPDYTGGGTVELVLDNDVVYLGVPERYEAGTPNFIGVMCLIDSIKQINSIGYNYIFEHEKYLLNYTINQLRNIPHVINYGDIINTEDRIGICTFNIENIYHYDVANILAKKYGISIRHGWFCAHPYCRRLMNIDEQEACKFLYDDKEKMYGMVRVSFGLYNTCNEVNTFLNAINDISKCAK